MMMLMLLLSLMIHALPECPSRIRETAPKKKKKKTKESSFNHQKRVEVGKFC